MVYPIQRGKTPHKTMVKPRRPKKTPAKTVFVERRIRRKGAREGQRTKVGGEREREHEK